MESPKPSTSFSSIKSKPSLVKSRSLFVNTSFIPHEAPVLHENPSQTIGATNTRTEMSSEPVASEFSDSYAQNYRRFPATAREGTASIPSEPLVYSDLETPDHSFVYNPENEVTSHDIENYLQKCECPLPPSSETGATVDSYFTSGIPPSHIVFKSDVVIGSQCFPALIDTGASFSAINPEVIRSYPQSVLHTKRITPFSFKLSVGISSQQTVSEKVTVNFYCHSTLFSWQFYVIPGLSNRIVLGMDWLRKNNVSLDCNSQKIIFGSIPNPISRISQHQLPKETTAPCIRVVEIPAQAEPVESGLHAIELETPHKPKNANTISVHSSCLIPAKNSRLVEIVASEPISGDVVVTPNYSFQNERQLAVGSFITTLKDGRGSTYVTNLKNEQVQIIWKTQIGTYENYVNENPCDVDQIVTAHLQALICEPPQDEAFGQMSSLEVGTTPRSQEILDKLNTFHLGEDVTPEQKEKLLNLLESYLDIFSFTADKLGRSNNTFHRIDTGDAQPIRQRAYRVSPTERDHIKAKVQELLDRNMIEPSNSPWSSPVILVQQKDKVRFCVDYRKLNAVTRKDCYPLPRIDDTLDHLSGAKYFSSMDCDMAFHQVGIAPEDKEKTAFNTPGLGLFQYNVMPFGLCNAPSTFQRLIDNVLGQLKWSVALVYLDDTVVFSKTFEEHLVNLSLVFEAFRKSNLTLKPTKCNFADSKLDFLGHVISANGVSVNPKKVHVVENFPQPKTVKDVQSFVSLCSYFRKFIENFSKIAQPLIRLTQKGVPFVWDDQTETAFQTFKTKLTTAPILAYPIQGAETFIHTDACGHGLGAALYQKQNKIDRVIAYASRSLTPGEKNYAATHLECLGVVWAIETFRPYIYGQHFKVVTDHHSLCYLLNLKDPNGQLARWCLRLMPYNFEIVHKSGAAHTDADTLSRYPVDPPPKDDSHLDLVHLLYHLDFENDDIACLQRADPNFKRIIDWLENPNDRVESEKPKQVDHYKLIGNNEGKQILYRANYDEFGQLWKLVLPRPMRQKIMKYVHEESAGHLGLYKTYQLLRSRYFWPGIYKDTLKFYNSCHTCQLFNRPTTLPHGTRNPLEPPTQAFERVGIDFIGPFPPSNRYTYAMTIVCHTTRYVEIWPVISADTKHSINILERHLIFRHSSPKAIVLDRDSVFTAHAFREFAKSHKIELIFNPAYYHQPNGICERHNDTIKRIIAKFVDKHKDWSKHLHRAAFAINITKNATTGQTPFYLVHGRHPNIENELPNIPDCIDDNESRVAEKRVTAAILVANANTKDAQQKEKAKYESEHKPHTFKVNDLVLYRNHTRKGEVKKFEPQWQGPYKIIKIIRDTIIIESDTREILANATQLKHYIPEIPPSMPTLSIVSSNRSHPSFSSMPNLSNHNSFNSPTRISISNNSNPNSPTSSLNASEIEDNSDESVEIPPSIVSEESSISPSSSISNSIPRIEPRRGTRARVQTVFF